MKKYERYNADRTEKSCIYCNEFKPLKEFVYTNSLSGLRITRKCLICSDKRKEIHMPNVVSPDSKERTCLTCNAILPIEEFRLYIDNSKNCHRSSCIKCEGRENLLYRKLTNGGRVYEIQKRIKARSRLNKLEYDLDKDWIYSTLEKQEWKCLLTKIPFSFHNDEKEIGTRDGYIWDSLSVDRINPNIGYTKENVRFVLNIVNTFKSNGSDERMYMIAKKLIENGSIVEGESK